MLDYKRVSKSGRKSNASYENEIYRADSHSSEDSKNLIFFAREGRPEILGKIVQKRRNILSCKLGLVNSNAEYWHLLSGTKIFALSWFPYMLVSFCQFSGKKFALVLQPSPP